MAQSGDITATFTRPVTSVTVSFAVWSEGTAEYSLTAYAPSGRAIANSSTTAAETSTGTGYHTLVVHDLPSKAKSFSMTGGWIVFGVNSITYTYGD